MPGGRLGRARHGAVGGEGAFALEAGFAAFSFSAGIRRGILRCNSRPSASCTTLVSSTDGSTDKVRTRNFVSQYGLPSNNSTRTGWSTTRSSKGAVLLTAVTSPGRLSAQDFVAIQPALRVGDVKDLLHRVVRLQRHLAALDALAVEQQRDADFRGQRSSLPHAHRNRHACVTNANSCGCWRLTSMSLTAAGPPIVLT